MSNTNILLTNLNTKNKVKQILSQKEEVKASASNIFNGEENVAEILSNLSGIEIEEIKNLSNEKVDEILTVQGEVMGIPESYVETKEDEYNFKKDLLLYLLQCEATLDELNKAEEEMEKILAENEEEVKNILDAYEGSMIGAIRDEIVKKESIATTPQLKKTHTEILEAFDDSFELSRVYTIYKELNVANTLTDFNVNFNNVYKQYSTVNKRLGVTFDLIKFGGLETKFLEEKYHKYPNLFIFIIMKYMAKRNGSITKHADGVFCSQLCTNLYLLFTDSLEETYKTQLIANITKILDLFI